MDEGRLENYTRGRARNHTGVTSVLIMDWKTVSLPCSMPPGLGPVGWYSHVERKNIIHSYMERGTGETDSEQQETVIQREEG